MMLRTRYGILMPVVDLGLSPAEGFPFPVFSSGWSRGGYILMEE
jgi:hypothetical protein